MSWFGGSCVEDEGYMINCAGRGVGNGNGVGEERERESSIESRER